MKNTAPRTIVLHDKKMSYFPRRRERVANLAAVAAVATVLFTGGFIAFVHFLG